MKQGIRDSSVFILVLTERTLASHYCRQEMLTAIEEEKPVQIILEEEKRFHPFNLDSWLSPDSEGDGMLRRTRSRGGHELPTAITEMIDGNLDNAVTYRRRDYEQEAMIREICRRNNVA